MTYWSDILCRRILEASHAVVTFNLRLIFGFWLIGDFRPLTSRGWPFKNFRSSPKGKVYSICLINMSIIHLHVMIEIVGAKRDRSIVADFYGAMERDRGGALYTGANKHVEIINSE